jgi:hypothetical protein
MSMKLIVIQIELTETTIKITIYSRLFLTDSWQIVCVSLASISETRHPYSQIYFILLFISSVFIRRWKY